MKTQNVLPFKLESTKERITGHSGLVLFGEFLHALGLLPLLDNNLPKPGSAIGYKPSEFVVPLLLSLHGGGSALEDLRVIRRDQGLLELLHIAEFPSPDAFGDWLLRCGKNRTARRSLEKIVNLITRRQLNREVARDYTLDIDASQVIAEKKTAHRTYKGELGYMPIVGHLAENGLVIGYEFREGNVSPHTRNLEFVKHCVANMPKFKRIAAFRADSASYQAALFNYLEGRKIIFAVGGHVDASVKTIISERPESTWRPYQNGHITEVVHCMNGTKKAFRLIIIRRPYQPSLPVSEVEAIVGKKEYFGVA
ncbi:MAG: transposase [Candidatus Riflebacteria bacterium]|nr:transposase [Candidatus Riflebacteria bacterium]